MNVKDAMARQVVLGALLLTIGCAGSPDAGRTSAALGVGASASRPVGPAPVLDTPSEVPEWLLVNTRVPALVLRLEKRQITLMHDGASRRLAIDTNELIFAGRHVTAHDSRGTIEVLVAGQSCQDTVSGEWVPYSARVTLDDGEFIFGCAQDAPPR
jgi:hypothetical protein